MSSTRICTWPGRMTPVVAIFLLLDGCSEWPRLRRLLLSGTEARFPEINARLSLADIPVPVALALLAWSPVSLNDLSIGPRRLVAGFGFSFGVKTRDGALSKISSFCTDDIHLVQTGNWSRCQTFIY